MAAQRQRNERPAGAGDRRGAHQRARSHHGVRQLRADARPQLHRPARRRLHHHGRQRLRQEHAAPAPDRPHRAGQGRGLLRRRELHHGRAGGARAHAAPLRHPLPERRTVQLDDAGRERRPAARRVHRPHAGGDPRGGGAQARAGRPQGLRGLLSVADQRRHAEARRAGARDGARPGHPVLRRAVGGARSDQLATARRPDPRAARQPRRHHRGRHPRARQHLHDRQQQHLPRRGEPHDDRQRRPARSCATIPTTRRCAAS